MSTKAKEQRQEWIKGYMLLEADRIGEPEHHEARGQRVLKLWPKFCVPPWSREGDWAPRRPTGVPVLVQKTKARTGTTDVLPTAQPAPG